MIVLRVESQLGNSPAFTDILSVRVWLLLTSGSVLEDVRFSMFEVESVL